MEVGYEGSTTDFLETEVVEDSEDWLEEEEGEDYDSDDRVVVLVLRNCKCQSACKCRTYIQS